MSSPSRISRTKVRSRSVWFAFCATFLTLFIAWSGAGAGAAAATDHRVTVTERVNLGVPPARAWDKVEDFMRWPSWHPAFASTTLVSGDGHSPGSVRLLIAKDGAQFNEELLAHNPAEHRLTYRILASPAPVIGYSSTITVQPTDSGSTVVWTSEFAVKQGTSEDDAKKAIAGIYRIGLDNLAREFAAERRQQ